MTLEHVLPEEPEGNWPQFTEEEHAAYWRRIGNLCLLPKGVNNDHRSADQKSKICGLQGDTLRIDEANGTRATLDERNHLRAPEGVGQNGP